MKTLVVYSTLTGNTKKVAEAIYDSLSGEKEILDVKDAIKLENCGQYDKVIVGYWVDKGDADAAAKKFMEKLSEKKVGTFGTLGAYPDSEHAQKSVEKVRAFLEEKNNEVIAEFICQGSIDPKLIERMRGMGMNGPHPVTPEREARWAEAAKHPDENDLKNAKEAFAKI